MPKELLPIYFSILFLSLLLTFLFMIAAKRKTVTVVFIANMITVTAITVFEIVRLSEGLPSEIADTAETVAIWFLAACLSLTILSTVGFLYAKRLSVEKETVSLLEPKVFAYLDKKGKLRYFTSEFFDELRLGLKKRKRWVKRISSLCFDNEEITYGEFSKRLTNEDLHDFKLTVVLREEFDDEGVSFNLVKEKVMKNGKILGYALLKRELKSASDREEKYVDGFSLVIDQLDVPYAYYNDYSGNIIFTINRKFKELLGIKGRTVTHNELRRLVFPGDLKVFDDAVNGDDDGYCYRLRTNNGLKMFSEIKRKKDRHVISVIGLADPGNEKYTTKSQLFNRVEQLIEEHGNFAGIIVSLNGFIDLFHSRGNAFAKEMTNRYIDYVTSEILREKDMICKISDIEYLLLLHDPDSADKIVRDAADDVSALTRYEFNFGNETITVKNTLGIVYANENIKSSRDFMAALDTALAYANTEGYERSYSIYNSGTEGIRPFKKRDVKQEYPSEMPAEEPKKYQEPYSFDKIKIDLDNGFLDDDEV